MSSSNPTAMWWEQAASMNQQYTDAVEQTVAAQSRFVDAWLDSVDDATSQDRVDEGAEAVVNAYDIWMQAAQDTVEQMNDAMEGEDVQPEQFRNTWLNAANRAFKEAMRTSAFAHATGESIDDALQVQQFRDELTEELLHEYGLPTTSDIEEVGERLVELERRQHKVEQRLDDVLDALEGEE